MKKLKIKKRMTSFLMLVAMAVSIIGVMPKTVAYADNASGSYTITESRYRDDGTEWVNKDGKQYVYTVNPVSMNGDKLYMFCDNSKFGKKGVSGMQGFILCRDVSNGAPDLKSFEVNWTSVNDGRTGSIGTTSVHKYTYEGHTYSYACYFGSSTHSYKSNASKSFGVDFKSLYAKFGNDDSKVYKYLLRVALHEIQDTTMVVEAGSDTSEDLPGTSSNPIRDKSVGYPDIHDYKFLIVSPSTHSDDGEHGEWDKLKNADYIKWKSKSTTGFNLIKPDDKYKNVYIQAKIVSRFQYNDSFWGNGEWHNYDNYGEEGYFDFINPSDKELTVSFQQLTELLPKTHAEKHHFKKYNFDYDYYFRIVYTRADDLKVIPTYYSGGWRRISCHSNNGKHDENGEGKNSSAVITDGDDEGGKWKTDKDSKDNDKNIDNGTGEGSDLDDAKDDADNKKKDTSSGSLDIDSVKGFMNEVGNVPKAIGKLFSFLPDWVTTFIGFGFVVLVALMIIKAVRG